MKIKKKYVTAIAAATIIITAIIIHCYTLGMTNTEVERIPLNMAQVGDYLFIDENNNAYVVHKENFAAVDDTSKCVAVVFALETSYEDKKKGYKHGYAMALKNAGKDIPYGEPDTKAKLFRATEYFQDYREGRKDTRTLNKAGKHPAAEAAAKYNGGKHPRNSSEWFLPAIGQWYDIIVNLGKVRTRYNIESGSVSWQEKSTFITENINMSLEKAGKYAEPFNLSEETFQSSSEMNDGFAYVAYFTGNERAYLIGSNKDSGNTVRPIIAF